MLVLYHHPRVKKISTELHEIINIPFQGVYHEFFPPEIRIQPICIPFDHLSASEMTFHHQRKHQYQTRSRIQYHHLPIPIKQKVFAKQVFVKNFNEIQCHWMNINLTICVFWDLLDIFWMQMQFSLEAGVSNILLWRCQQNLQDTFVLLAFL